MYRCFPFILLVAIVLVVGTQSTCAQQLGRRTLSSSGATSKSSPRLSWTLGQVETKGLRSADSSIRITQGYQQMYSTWPGAKATISIQSCAAAAGERVTSDIVLTRENNGTNFGPSFLRVLISYNASLLYAEALSNGASLIRMDYNAALDSTVLEIQVPVNDQRAASQVLSTITFVAGLGNDTTCALDIISVTPVERNIGITIVDGTFTLLNYCKEGGDRLLDVSGVEPILMVAPNPVVTAGTIRYRTAEDGPLQLAMYSYDGRLVRMILDASVPAGDYEVGFPLLDLANGQYLLVMKTGAFRLTTNVSVNQ